ncbi:hypothetical protein JTB14_021542 [Gonioctena quinquepunctata]|nr:hypothetical protein JTB14_021542 [Gonioctena quinquepunctata]
MDGTKSDFKQRKQHPIDRGNILNQIFFCWFPSYLLKGLRKQIDEDDMYEIRKSQESTYLGDKLESAWLQEKKSKNPSLLKALFIVFRGQLALSAIFHMFSEGVKIFQPVLISKLVSFFEPNSPAASPGEIYTYAAIVVLSCCIQVLCNHNYMMFVLAVGMKIRVAACSLIYRKSLKLSKSALAETTIGQMVNLLSNDVGRFDFATQHIHHLWMAPLETVIVMYLLYIYVGLSGLVGTVFLLSFIPFQMYMAKLTSRYRLRTAICTDERVRLMNEIISGIQVIKMYTWEKPFTKLVAVVRKREINQIRATSIIRAIMMSCNIVMARTAVFLCILTYVLTGNTLDATYAYTVSSFYGLLRNAVTQFFPQAITQFAETKVSVKRVQQFLLYEELPKGFAIEIGMLNGASENKRTVPESMEVGVHLRNMSVKWLRFSTENSLESINFNVSSNQLVAVVGPVGGGKTTLLHAILKELSPVEGSAHVVGTISYASQEPWVFGGSVRQNILFGQKYVQKKYEEVVRVCALQRDFTLFPHGDRTLVGERGVALSGGQRARINLARAVYKEADIYLLDDPLSAVDTHVGKQLFNECIRGYLRNKCVVLVTHQLQYLRNTHCIYLLENGEVRSSGTYQELKNSDNDFTKLLAASEEEEKKEEMRRLSKVEQNESTETEDLPAIVEDREERASGTITWHVYRSYLKAGGNWCKTFALFSLFLMTQVLGSSSDYFLTIWVNSVQWREENKEQKLIESLGNETTSSPKNIEIIYDLLATQDITITIYTCLIVLTIFITVTRSITFFRFCMTASTRLHNSMFSKIVFSTMRFFNTNPSGRILNRFSKDIGAIDESLPLTIVDTMQIGLTVLAITLVIATMNPWILIPTVIILIIFHFIRQAFLSSSRNIKRVEAITRSPIYTHLAASLQGITTIRAFGAEEILTKEFDNYQDAYTSAYFMFLTANRGFGFWLDLHCVIFIALVVVSILFIQNESFGGNVGLSLTQAMTLSGMFQWGMRQWSELENQMTSVERVQEYADIVPERDNNTRTPPKSWPEAGSLKFDNVSLRYSETDPAVLRNLTFEIKPREKIGIVGRTGAGKSSLIQALFRLADTEGSILIDDVDTKTVSLNILRSEIAIIPQEPVLFSGTLRKNLDPFDEYQDESLWNALEEVELKHAVDELPAGLDSKMAEGGSNFSVGQRQLLCLARAIVRNNKILVLDEATANVDPQTDALIQNTIRQKFANCTVMTIAHRLHTIMDSDKVLVMDAGLAVEFDHPYMLLQNKSGLFYGLVKQTGLTMAGNLHAIAEENFVSRTTEEQTSL